MPLPIFCFSRLPIFRFSGIDFRLRNRHYLRDQITKVIKSSFLVGGSRRWHACHYIFTAMSNQSVATRDDLGATSASTTILSFLEDHHHHCCQQVGIAQTFPDYSAHDLTKRPASLSLRSLNRKAC